MYQLVSTKFWGKYIQKDELKAKFGQNSSIVGTKFMSWHQVEKRSPVPGILYLSFGCTNSDIGF